MRTYLLLFFLLVTTFCSYTLKGQNSSDPISALNFKSASLNNFIDYMLVENIIENKVDKYSFYGYLFPFKSSGLPLSINFNPDGFENNTLRQLRIYLESDTVYQPEPVYRKGRGPISKIKVDHILQSYQAWYGDYDTILYPPENKPQYPKEFQEFADKLFEGRESKMTEEEKERIQQNKTRTYVWYEQDYTIEFYLPEYEDHEYTGNIPSYNGASITYSIKDYQKQLKKIQDSIRKEMKPRDIVELSLEEPVWEEDQFSTKFSFRIKDIYRTSLASQIGGFENITAVKYDVIVKNLFDEDLARFEDAIFELPTPMGESVGGYGYYNVGGSLTYGNGYGKAKKFNAAKDFAKGNTVKLVADIKAIVLGNGQIIQK